MGDLGVVLHRGLAVGAVVLRVELLRLVDGVDDAEVVLGVLEIALGHHAVTAAGRVAAELEIFLEQLLGRAADAQVGTVAVEDVVAVEGDVAALVPGGTAATATAATAAAVVPATHAFHVHSGLRLFFGYRVGPDGRRSRGIGKRAERPRHERTGQPMRAFTVGSPALPGGP